MNKGVKAEPRQEVLIQVYFRGLQIDILKNDATNFSMAYEKKDLSVLVILLFNQLFRHNYELRPSAIKLYVVVKYAYRLEHTKSQLIIGRVSDNWDI